MPDFHKYDVVETPDGPGLVDEPGQGWVWVWFPSPTDFPETIVPDIREYREAEISLVEGTPRGVYPPTYTSG